jgi:hypothetical protein
MHKRDHHQKEQLYCSWPSHHGNNISEQLQLVIITAEIADLLFSSSPSSYTTPTMPFILYEDA